MQVVGRGVADDAQWQEEIAGGEAPAADLDQDESNEKAVDEVIAKGHGASVSATAPIGVSPRVDRQVERSPPAGGTSARCSRDTRSVRGAAAVTARVGPSTLALQPARRRGVC